MRIFNLSRLLRPKQFSQIIAQELVVKILCNSLALKKIFPTYIFAGQRGLGKTTSARVFGAALLCENSQELLKSRSLDVPCLTCHSCQLIAANKHPDFIEIDAASNPGVDNVREIQENAFLTPVVGQYKIYLIDEVHMLSRAAFNAFLKMLEEPPSTAVFLMATTEVHKVPETIRSRSLQLLFWPLPWATMTEFLSKIAQENDLQVGQDVLKLLSQLSEGSFRDAINRLEQLSLLGLENEAEQFVACKKLFGMQDFGSCLKLLDAVLDQDKDALIGQLEDCVFGALDPARLFEQLLTLINKALEYKIVPQAQELGNLLLVEFAQKRTVEKLRACAGFFWANEEFFYASKNKELLLKSLLMQSLLGGGFIGTPGSSGSLFHGDGIESSSLGSGEPVAQVKVRAAVKHKKEAESASGKTDDNLMEQWQKVLENPTLSSDKLLFSILKQAKNVTLANEGVLLHFSSGGDFFKTKIHSCQHIILNAAREQFQLVNHVAVEMGHESGAAVVHKKPTARPVQSSLSSSVSPSSGAINADRKLLGDQNPKVGKKANKLVDLDEKQWPKSSLMVDLFQGSVESE